MTVFIDLIGFGIVLPVLPLYAKTYGAAGIIAGLIVASYSLMQFLFAPWWGRLSDRIGRRPVYIVGAIGAAAWGFIGFPMMDTGNYLFVIGAIVLGLMIHALMYSPQPAIMAEMFPTRMRYSGVSLGYQVTSIVAGSLAPIISVKLLDIYDSWVPIAIYLAVAAIITLVAALFMRETNGVDLAMIDAADREQLAEAGAR